MKTAAMLFALCGCVLLTDAPASGEVAPEVDCDNAMTQRDMNMCAAKDYQEADQALNLQWTETRKVVAERDAQLDPADRGGAKALLAAQRAWISYRDGQCEASGYSAYGGSMQPMLISSCRATMTRARTQELRSLAESFGQ